MLRKLESELGVRLFVRDHNKLMISSAGECVLQHVEMIQKQIDLMKKDLEQYKKSDDEISIRFCNKAVMWYFTPRFKHAYPDIRLESDFFDEKKNCLELLVNQKADILVVSHPLQDARIECIPFLKDQHYFSVPADHRIADFQNGIYMKDIQEGETIYYLEQSDDSFCRLYKSYMDAHYPSVKHKNYQDYFLFSQEIQGSDILAISTKLAILFRNDGPGRVMVPILDEGLYIQMYLCCLKEKRKKLKPILNWQTYADGTQ